MPIRDLQLSPCIGLNLQIPVNFDYAYLSDVAKRYIWYVIFRR